MYGYKRYQNRSDVVLASRYKAEGEMKAEPEKVFSFIDPSPSSPRAQWDKAIKELQLVDQIDEVHKSALLQSQKNLILRVRI